jgi:ornithine carbamoyltransferase
MANSLMIGSAKMGVHFTILAPKSLWPQPELVEQCQEYAKESGSVITLSEDLAAVEGADAGYAYVLLNGKTVGKVPVVFGQTIEQKTDETEKHRKTLFR